MSHLYYPVAQCGIGTAYASYTTAKSILPPSVVYIVQPNALYVGKRYRITARIALSNITAAQPTFTFQVMGGPTSNIILWTSPALLATTTAHTGYPCLLQADLTCAAIGSGTAANFYATAQIDALGLVLAGAVADPTVGSTRFILPNATVAAPASGAAGFDSTVATVIDLFVGISVSQPTNGVQIYDYQLEDANGP